MSFLGSENVALSKNGASLRTPLLPSGVLQGRANRVGISACSLLSSSINMILIYPPQNYLCISIVRNIIKVTTFHSRFYKSVESVIDGHSDLN